MFGLNLLNFKNQRVKKLFNANCQGKRCFKNAPTIHVDLELCYYDFEPEIIITKF
jgi:hypothetical protein